MAAGDLATLRRHQWQDAVCDRRGVIAAFLVRQIRGRRIAPNAIFLSRRRRNDAWHGASDARRFRGMCWKSSTPARARTRRITRSSWRHRVAASLRCHARGLQRHPPRGGTEAHVPRLGRVRESDPRRRAVPRRLHRNHARPRRGLEGTQGPGSRCTEGVSLGLYVEPSLLHSRAIP